MAGCQMIPFPKTENNDMPANILNLDAYNITGIQENEHDYHIDAETKQPPTCCPHCNSSALVGFDVPKPPKPYQEPSTQPEKNYGADISTLIRLIESGEL